ncbi:MAG: tRNA G46 methylase TrmB [Bacteriovoracaceae bacterium]|jgi:tRNA G46 methylase TrmB
MDIDKSLKKIRPFTAPPLQDYVKFIVPKLPLDIEIGCGVGLHPILYQQKHPERCLVALEHTKEKFDKFYRRFINHGSPQNLIPVHANGISWVSQQLPNESVDQFFFLYPNPNPKPGDLNKRWYAMPFMQKVLEVLKPDGKITLATNEKFYKEEALEYFLGHWKLKLIEDKILESGFKPRTHFEKKYLEREEPCFNLVFSK